MKSTPDVYKIRPESRVNENLLKKLIANGKIKSISFFDCKPFIDFDRFKHMGKVAYVTLLWTLSAAGVVNFILETRYKVDYSEKDDNDEFEMNKIIIMGMANYFLVFNDRYPEIDLRNAVDNLNTQKVENIRDYLLVMLHNKV